MKNDSREVSERFRRRDRVRSQRDFSALFKQGKVLSDQVLVIHAVPSQYPFSRLGISMSRKVGSAPVRNRWKRLLREAFRRQRSEIPTGLDFVVRPRMGAQPDGQAIRKSMVSLTRGLKKKWSHHEPEGSKRESQS